MRSNGLLLTKQYKLSIMKLKSKLSGLFKRKRTLKDLNEFVSKPFDRPTDNDDCAFTLVAYSGKYSGCILGNGDNIAELIANACIANDETMRVVKNALEEAEKFKDRTKKEK